MPLRVNQRANIGADHTRRYKEVLFAAQLERIPVMLHIREFQENPKELELRLMWHIGLSHTVQAATPFTRNA